MENNIYFTKCMLQIVFTSMTLFCSAQNFTKVFIGPLVSTPGDSRSINWVDMNNDGFIDCFITNGPAGGQNNNLFINNGAGGFTKLLNNPIVNDLKPSVGATCADMDNDGDIDCYVTNWYNTNNLLYTNNGANAFTQITSGSIVNDLGYSETATWGDYDNDGMLDLYVTNSDGNKKNFLYHNNGSLGFSKITSGSMVNDAFYSRSANWTDIDNDADLDLFVSNEFNENENIYRNDGGGVFTKLTTGALLTDGRNTMSSSWGDYDNDGDLDVFLTNDLSNNALFRNDGNFVFTKMINDTVSKETGHSFSSAWSDVDNDGDLDLFVTNSFGTVKRQLNWYYINNGNGTFTRNGTSILATDSSWSYGCAFGDYDNDGFEDLAVATTRFKNFDYPDLLYHNDGNTNRWLTITLNGTTANKSAIGAKIRLKATINGTPVWQMREISSQSSYCGQNDLRAHFGLGNATQIDSIKVEWLLGNAEIFTNITTNQFVSITQNYGISNIEALVKLSGINVFPNPAEDIVSISKQGSPFFIGDKITVTNILGQKLYETKIDTPIEIFPLNLKQITSVSLHNSVCFITVQTELSTVTKKIVVNGTH